MWGQAGRYGGLKLDQRVMARRINWLNSIREWQSEFVNSLSAREFVDCITDDLLGRGVFVFTPSGEVMRLPKVCPLSATFFAEYPWMGSNMLHRVQSFSTTVDWQREC